MFFGLMDTSAQQLEKFLKRSLSSTLRTRDEYMCNSHAQLKIKYLSCTFRCKVHAIDEFPLIDENGFPKNITQFVA